MSTQLPLPTMDYEIYLSESSVQISLRPGVALSKYHRSMELKDPVLAAAWVLTDVLRTLDDTLSKQSTLGGHNG